MKLLQFSVEVFQLRTSMEPYNDPIEDQQSSSQSRHSCKSLLSSLMREDPDERRLRKERPDVVPLPRPADPERRHVTQATKGESDINNLIHQRGLLDPPSQPPEHLERNPPWESIKVMRAIEKRHNSKGGMHVISLSDAPISPSKLTTIVGSKVPEKRHIPNQLSRTITTPIGSQSNITSRLLSRFKSMMELQKEAFAASLLRSEKMAGSLSKGSLNVAFLEVGMKITAIDSEKLWEDLTDNGRVIVDTIEILHKFGINIEKSEIETLANISETVIGANEELYKMYVPKCNIGYTDDDLQLFSRLQYEQEDQPISNDMKPQNVPGKNSSAAGHDSVWTVEGNVEVPGDLSVSKEQENANNRLQIYNRLSSAINKLRGGKIDLALIYRRLGYGGVTGHALLEILLGPSIGLDLPYEEALILICDIARVSYLTDLDSFTLSYNDVVNFLDSKLPSGESIDQDAVIHENIRRFVFLL